LSNPNPDKQELTIEYLWKPLRCSCAYNIVGWVKRDIGTIYVGFAYLNTPQKFEIATKLANPTKGKNSFLKNQMTIFLFVSNFLLSKHLSASVPLWLNDYNK
jgi:hypothetical protein